MGAAIGIVFGLLGAIGSDGIAQVVESYIYHNRIKQGVRTEGM